MNKARFFCISLLLAGLALTGCRRSGGEVWEDTKSASRHMGRGLGSLGGKHGDSRQIDDPDEFYAYAEEDNFDSTASGTDNSYVDNSFIPLQDDNQKQGMSMADDNFRQAKESPGDPGSTIPGVEAFSDPATNSAWSGVFRNVYFEYNSSLIKGQDNLSTIRNIADYMKKNSSIYIFVEGHTDERGAEAYNLALGSHRANAVRNLLINEGVSPDNIFTVSYGKERPLLHEHHDEAWAQNRRAEFKIYRHK